MTNGNMAEGNMKNRNMSNIKWVLAVFVLTMTISVDASVMCAGETYGGDVVFVSVRTAGSMGAVQDGAVEFIPNNGGAYAYGIQAEHIPQFFEDSQRAIVGLAAYVDTQGPVLIRYVGRNYRTESHGEMIRILRSTGRPKISGNQMIVWKGPGYSYSSRFIFRDVVCSILINP